MTKSKLAKMMEDEFELLYIEDSIKEAVEKNNLPYHPIVINQILDLAMTCEAVKVKYTYNRLAKQVNKDIKSNFRRYIKE